MEIFVTLLALAFLQVWGAKNPLHKDAWFYFWQSQFERVKLAQDLTSFLVIAIPLAVLALVSWFLAEQSDWLMLPVAVVVLLYSFGRGEFFEIVREYTQACYVEDWQSATNRAQRFEVDVESVENEDWSSLHKQVFDEASYRGFERLFAVLFWFFVLGPVGAFMYRLVFLKAQQSNSLATRWLWIMEWPAVRVLGLSFALTGNFASCMPPWREYLASTTQATKTVLSAVILGALSVNEDQQLDCEVTRKELTLMSKLYQRTLWFWMCILSLIIIFI